MKWSGVEYKNEAHRLFLQADPIFICWNLWKYRCARRYGGKKSNLIIVKFLVFRDTFFLMKIVYPYVSWPGSWNGMVDLVERFSHDIKITPVLWSKPP